LIGLLDNGFLNQIPWTKDWVEVVSIKEETRQEMVRTLKRSEVVLKDAIHEEERKCLDTLKCPQCQQSFIVDQRKCGSFVCGRDSDSSENTPQIGGQNITGVYGCGFNFSIASAARYEKDESLLEPLRIKVQEEMKKLSIVREKQQIWKQLENFELPYLTCKLVRDTEDCQPILPTSFFSNIDSADCGLIWYLMMHRLDLEQFKILPDLIEFYLWLHSTFRFLMSKEQAMKINLKELMSEHVLQKRFEPVTVDYLLRLWERLKDSFNKLLDQLESTVMYECEDVAIPFKNIEDSCLIMFLSVYDHPTEGYDYLFLIINSLIEKYNLFRTKLNQFIGSDNSERNASLEEEEMNAKMLVHGSPGSLALGSLILIIPEDMIVLVESYRKPLSNEYDINELVKNLRQALKSIFMPQLISNPFMSFREMFDFRLDGVINNCGLNDTAVGLTSSQGDSFVRIEDLRLFEDCKQLLNELNLKKGCIEIKKVFTNNFHNFEYDKIRSMLSGIRTLLQNLPEERNFNIGEHERETVAYEMKEMLGFPLLTDSQVSFITSLEQPELVELVSFFGYQLASEAYTFSRLPSSMSSMLAIEICNSIKSKMLHLFDQDGRQFVIKVMDGFLKDVLFFYESEILKEASSNTSLVEFLRKNNFCDSADAFFAIIPNEVSVQNYVSLCQLIHQLKLSLSTDIKMSGKRGNTHVKEKDEGCWLWSSETKNSPCDEKALLAESSFFKNYVDVQEHLWFEECYNGNDSLSLDNDTSIDNNTNSNEDEMIDQDTISLSLDKINLDSNFQPGTDRHKAALSIQVWWKSRDRKDEYLSKPHVNHPLTKPHGAGVFYLLVFFIIGIFCLSFFIFHH